MRYRSKANPRVTIEAMRLPAESEDASDELVDWLGKIEDCFSDYDGGLAVGRADGDEMLRINAEEWVLKDANGFVQRATHEEFEAEWEPIDEQ
jgi:hypothetical protein